MSVYKIVERVYAGLLGHLLNGFLTAPGTHLRQGFERLYINIDCSALPLPITFQSRYVYHYGFPRFGNTEVGILLRVPSDYTNRRI